jgi:HAD superfamily hydrolase (TIGR01509 family)
MKARAILWDLDGVIVNSGRYHFEAYRWLLAQHGIDLTEERFFAEFFGRRNREIIQAALRQPSEEDIRRLSDQKETKFRELVAGNISALLGAAELLRRAHGAALKQAIVSSTPRANIDLVIGSLGLRDCLDAIVGEEDSERGKPDAQPFMTAADRLGVPYGECVVIEDAPEGIEAGKAAGMRVIGVATTRPVERLSRADLVVASLGDERVWGFIVGVWNPQITKID